jgi:hypothetical protein
VAGPGTLVMRTEMWLALRSSIHMTTLSTNFSTNPPRITFSQKKTLCLPNLWWYYPCDLANPRLYWNDKKLKKKPFPLLPYLRDTQSIGERKEIFAWCKQENEVFVFREIHRNSWLAAKLLASQ